MRITHTTIFVSDQAKALEFYTTTLGFAKKQDLPLGQFRWLTVVSPESPAGPELVLEPNDNKVAQVYQKGIFEQGIPAILFGVDNVQIEYDRLKSLGVVFSKPPTKMGNITIAVFDDTCGNLVQMVQT